MEALMTREQAAQQLGISTDTLDRLRKAGKISFVQHVTGGKVWFSEQALAEFLARCTHPARPEAPTQGTYRKRRQQKTGTPLPKRS